MTASEIENDHFDLDHFDRDKALDVLPKKKLKKIGRYLESENKCVSLQRVLRNTGKRITIKTLII